MTADTRTSGPGPYATAALRYWAAGWRGVLPLPERAKANPPKGWTGATGGWPSYPDVHAWTEGAHAGGNIALRLPPHVIGLDVDAYDGKPGAATIAEAEARWGALPATWRSTSRDDGVSGIRLYRVPEGLAWPGELGDATEIIQTRHRYAVAWPSLHPEGRTYRWIDPTGVVSTAVPEVDALPDLPDAWVAGLTGGALAGDAPAAPDLDRRAVAAWLGAAPGGAPCRRTTMALDRYLADLRSGDKARHVVARDATLRLAHLAAEGHTGALDAMAELRRAFLDAITTGDGARDRGTAEHEWDSLLTGAVRLASLDAPGHEDPCDNPLSGLIDNPAAVVASTAPAPSPLADPEPDPADTPAPALAVVDPEAPRSSWLPVDLGPHLDGTYEPETPTLLRRDDDLGLLYPGRVHSIYGESESGKSFVTLLAVLDAVHDSRDALVLDFESDAATVVGRLLSLGLDRDDIAEHVRYVRPDRKPGEADLAAYHQLLEHPWAVVVVDGLTEALVMWGGVTKDNDAVTAFMRALPRRLARAGAAVVTIDHVAKDKDTRGRFAIGAQAKMASLDGAAYLVEPVEAIAPGRVGRLEVRVAKDRPGTVRSRSGTWRARDRTQLAATITLDSTVPDAITATVAAPDRAADAPAEWVPFRPTHLMEAVSIYLEAGAEATLRQLRDDIKGTKAYITLAASTLVDEGYVERISGPRRSYLHRSIKPYREAFDGLLEVSDDVV